MADGAGEEHEDTWWGMAMVADAYSLGGEWNKAEKLRKRVMEERKTKLGVDHPDTLTSMHNLAFSSRFLGRSVEAIALMQHCVRQRSQILRDEHPDLVSSLGVLEQWKAVSKGWH